jgi:predicted RNase H-like nuclease (RuvC/YqgF family)
MEHTSCTCESCRKVFKKPILVTNFVISPRKETYYACPYCLTKIGNTIKESSITPLTVEETVEPVYTENEEPEEESMQPENSATPQEPVNGSSVTKAFAIEKLETLEKEKADLLAELEELRKGATEKISVLEEEVTALREEAELLRKLTEN